MYKIERRFGGTYNTHPVYTAHEADAQALTYHDDWTRCRKGEWGRTDDGYVMRCHNIYRMDRDYENKETWQFKFTAGSPMVRFARVNGEWVAEEDPVFEFLPYLRTGGYGYATPKTWQEAEAQKARTKRAVQLWAKFFVLRNGQLEEQDWLAIGRVYRSDDAIKDPVATARRLFNIDEVQRKAMDELAQLIHEAGETPEDVVEKYNRLFDESVDGDTEDKQVALSVADRLRDMSGLNPERRRPDPDQQGGSAMGLLQRTEQEEQEMGRIEDADAEVLPNADTE